MKHIWLSVLILIMAASVTGCSTSPVCVTSSVTPLHDKTVVENFGRCEGSDTAYSFLGLFMFGRPDLDLAVKNALLQKGGDTLINVRCYTTSRWYLFLGSDTVVVEGEAVKLGSSAPEKKGTEKKWRVK